MKEFWNERYASKEYAYGTMPNQYFKTSLDQLAQKGKILLPAEGEGRNAIFAAQQGYEVHAFDTSIVGQTKALKLAKQNNVSIKYTVEDMATINYPADSFDVIALIYAHFPPNVRSAYHQKITTWLKPNGHLIFEGFSKKHLQIQKQNPKVGGPKNIDMLFSKEQLMKDFPNFNFLEIAEKTVLLNEGNYHVGQASVIRFIATLKD